MRLQRARRSGHRRGRRGGRSRRAVGAVATGGVARPVGSATATVMSVGAGVGAGSDEAGESTGVAVSDASSAPDVHALTLRTATSVVATAAAEIPSARHGRARKRTA